MIPPDSRPLRLDVRIPPVSAAAPRAFAPELRLWQEAVRQAAAGPHFRPGRAEVAEKIGPAAEGDLVLSFAAELRELPPGTTIARRLAEAARHHPLATAPLAAQAHRLLQVAEEALVLAAPLAETAEHNIRRAMEQVVDGRRCVVYHTARRTAALNLELSIWVDAEKGHAVRIDFRGANLDDSATDTRLTSAYGCRRYELDPAGRWLLRAQTCRLGLTSADPSMPPNGYVERTTTFGDHWEPTAPAPVAEHADTPSTLPS